MKHARQAQRTETGKRDGGGPSPSRHRFLDQAQRTCNASTSYNTRSLRLFFLIACGLLTRLAAAQPYYVAPDGSDANAGTLEQPFATVERALALVVPGDTVYVRGGTYRYPAALRIDASGTEGQYLNLWAYPGEVPVLDFTGAPRGIDLRGSYVYIKGLVAEHAEDNGVYVKRASHNRIEQMVARFNGDSGVQVEDGSAYNLLLNVDSYGNYDAQNHGENADGFAIKFGVGPGNVLRGCRAWGNSDDGYDFWEAGEGVTVEESWAFRNGHNVWDGADFEGNSNGFKLGHGSGAHRLVRNLAWGHRAHGFDVNGNTSGVTLYHNTAFDNLGRNFYFDDDANVEQGLSLLRNNVSVGGSVRMDDAVTDHASNSWNPGFNAGGADFVSLNDAGSDGPRQADGSLPVLGFLRLAEGSDLIDTGEDVGLAFLGSAPDLGAFEFGDTGIGAEDHPEVPRTIRWLPNYPNPFLSVTHLAFELGEAGPIRLTIYDLLGRLVATLVEAPRPAGRHTVVWDAAGLPSGTYYARLEGPRHTGIRTLTLQK